MFGLLAGLDALVVGVVLLAVMLAVGVVLRPLLVNVLGQAPFIGGWLASNVDRGLADFQRSITTTTNNSLPLVASALQWLADQGRALTSGLTDLLNAVYWTTWTLATVTIPDAAAKTLQQAEQLAQDARGFSVGLFQQAQADINTSFGQAEAVAGAAVSAVRSDLEAEISAAEAVVLREIRKAEQATGDLFQQAEYDAGQLVAASEIKLTDLVSRAREDLGAAVGAVEHDLQLLAAAERVALEDSVSILGGDIQAAEARANAAIAKVEANIGSTVDEIIKSGPWAALIAAYTGGEAALKADVETLVRGVLPEIRNQIAQVATLRAKYAPQIRSTLNELKLVK